MDPSHKSPLILPFLGYAALHVMLELAYFSVPGVVAMYKKNVAAVTNKTSVNDVIFRMVPYGVLAYAALFVAVWEFLIKDIVCMRATGRRVDLSPDGDTLKTVVRRATVLALAVYGIFNFTNAATLGRAYSLEVVVMDTAWGVGAFNLLALTALVWAAR